MGDFSKALFEVRPALGADEEALDALRPLGTLCSCGTGTRERSPHKRARDALPPLLRAVVRGERGGDQSGTNADDEVARSDGAAERLRDGSSESSFIESPVIERRFSRTRPSSTGGG